MIDKSKPVLVTGGSGYIASWVVRKLLLQGYKVHTTVRNKSKIKKVAHLLKMQEKYPKHLSLFEADLLKSGSFEAAMKGCQLVIHTASPFKLDVKDPQKELVDPALKGTRNVLNEANKTNTVKRVVLTSSVVAIYSDATDLQKTPNNVFTEEHWNTTSSLKHQPYAYSKTLAEKEAWDIQSKQEQWDLVVINPGFVLGPSLSKRTDGQSTSFVIRLLSGEFKSGAPKLIFGAVDVREVAEAHILAGTTTDASGRHILVEGSHSIREMGDKIEKAFPNKYQLPQKTIPKFLLYGVGPFIGFSWKYINNNVGYPLNFDNSYSKQDLNLKYRPMLETLRDQAEQLERDGLI